MFENGQAIRTLPFMGPSMGKGKGKDKAIMPAPAVLEAPEDGPLGNDDELQFDDSQGEAAVEWEQLPPEREFFASPYDPPVKSLVQEISDKELIVRPTFQRYAVWDAVRQSKFVESILLNIPIPTLFFAEDDDKTKVVVDGQQRLLALKEYIENRYPLKGLEVLAALKGKRFDDLTERQQKIIKNRTLRCLVISAKSDSEIRFQVFERLNQGGVPLNAQEVRHSVYRGPLNDLLHELVTDVTWLKMLNLKKPHQRMNDCELILRFFALRDALPTYSPPLKNLLNEFMRTHRHAKDVELLELRAAFKAALEPIAASFGVVAFRRFIPAEDNKIRMDRSLNRAVFDVQMLVMEGLDPQWSTAKRGAIVKAYIETCLKDEDFMDSISRATADKTRMEKRLRKFRDMLKELGADLPFEDRIP